MREHEAIKAWEEETEVKFKTVPVAIVDPDSPPISDSRDILNYFAERHDGPLRLTPDVDASLQWAYVLCVAVVRAPSPPLRCALAQVQLCEAFPCQHISFSIRGLGGSCWKNYVGTLAWSHVLALSVQVFQYISNTPLSLSDKLKVRVGGAALMWVVANFRIKKALGVNDPRAALCEGGEAWMQRGKLGEGEPFHGGDAVDMADVVVWGMLSSMTGMRTLSDLRANVPALDAWYSAVEATMPAAAQ